MAAVLSLLSPNRSRRGSKVLRYAVRLVTGLTVPFVALTCLVYGLFSIDDYEFVGERSADGCQVVVRYNSFGLGEYRGGFFLQLPDQAQLYKTNSYWGRDDQGVDYMADDWNVRWDGNRATITDDNVEPQNFWYWGDPHVTCPPDAKH